MEQIGVLARHLGEQVFVVDDDDTPECFWPAATVTARRRKGNDFNQYAVFSMDNPDSSRLRDAMSRMEDASLRAKPSDDTVVELERWHLARIQSRGLEGRLVIPELIPKSVAADGRAATLLQ